MDRDTILIVTAVTGLCIALYLIPRWRHWLFSLLVERVALGRTPDIAIGGRERPYMLRWWIIPKNPFFNIYLHNILRSDDDRALHDHPWFNCSIVLSGGFFEVTPMGRFWRKPGAIRFRSAWSLHRLELALDPSNVIPDSNGDYAPRPAWTLFVTGPVLRQWGFRCPHGWISSRNFAKATDPGEIGRGCDQPADRE